jgi:TatD DNase family protein
MFEYFDIHSHLSFPDYDKDREELIEEMQKNKIATISVGVDFETSKKELELAEKYENIFACVGQHPENTKEGFDERILQLAENPKVVAIGECGLDYFRLPMEDTETKKIQKEIFEKQIELSLKVGKPLMLHIRPSDKISYDAYFDALEILESHAKTAGEKLRGNAHFFVGGMEVLKRFLSIGFTVSFAGVVTFTHEYDEYVRYAPLEMIMSETDAPFVAPAPFRGKRNSSLYIPEIVSVIARIRGEDLALVKKTLVENAVRNFNI